MNSQKSLVSMLGPEALKDRLAGEGLRFRTGPFNISLRSSIPDIARHVAMLYPCSEALDEDDFIDFNLIVHQVAGIRRWIRPQVVFSFDGYKPFKPLPLAQASAAFEWGLNWCIASSSHQYLIIHAAVIEKDGRGLIFPGAPGSGKSTLCAALVHSGWRLLSDEMALISIDDGMIYPVPRPVSLKNQSVGIIKEFFQDANWGARVAGTAKGDIEHMRAPEESVLRQSIAVNAGYFVFPQYKPGCDSVISPLSRGMAAMRLVQNSFNYNILGRKGFDLISELVDSLQCCEFSYPDLEQALAGVEQITLTERESSRL